MPRIRIPCEFHASGKRLRDIGETYFYHGLPKPVKGFVTVKWHTCLNLVCGVSFIDERKPFRRTLLGRVERIKKRAALTRF